jgi:HAD superfamily hydrolase (TIGR01549 family)
MSCDRRSITALLFDWDGTVVDSAPLGLAAFERTFAVLGVPFPQEIYEASYSPNWYMLYEALGLPKEKWSDADRLWLEHYGQQTAELIPGAGDAIRHLQRKNYRLGVVSSGSDSRLAREIKHVGLEDAFDVVICNEHMVNKKPHPEGLHTAMRLLDCVADATCYVGDSPEDIEMGKRAKVMTVSVRSSYPTSSRASEAHPDLCLESLAALIEHF